MISSYVLKGKKLKIKNLNHNNTEIMLSLISKIISINESKINIKYINCNLYQ